MSAIDEEVELAKTDGRTWYDIRERPPRDRVLAFRDVHGRVGIAMNCVPDGMTQWAFLR